MITYKKGNVLDQVFDKPTIITHICNDAGGFGSGFAGAVAERYPTVKTRYQNWSSYGFDSYKPASPFKLGQIQFVRVSDNLTFCNMIAQSTPKGRTFYISGNKIHIPPIRYQSLEECLFALKEAVQDNNINIVGPKFGSGLAGGNWYEIEKLIAIVGLDITIYELES